MVDASDHLCVYQKEKTPMHVWAFRFEVLILARQEGKCESRISNFEFRDPSQIRNLPVEIAQIRDSQFEIRASSYRPAVGLSLIANR